MFNKQETFKLTEEKKTIIVAKQGDNPVSKMVIESLGIHLEDLNDASFSKVQSLGKIPAKWVVFINQEDLTNNKKVKSITKGLASLKEDSVVLLDSFKETTITPLFETLTKAEYRFNKFKTEDKPKTNGIAYTTTKNLDQAIHEGIVFGEAINHTRELINTPYNYLNAEKLAEYAEALNSIPNVSVKIYEKSDCESMNMGAFLGVNKGSTDAPKLIHVTYTGNSDSDEQTALVGKGVMYDTGGYSLKTPQSMPSMKMDMGGAATVLGAIEAIARLEAKANVSVVIAATDNRIGDNAVVPDDILTSAKGLTIEIVSTDAEGRLTLADALWFAQEKGATRLIDVATLTGAVVAALGDAYTGAFTNNETFLNELQQAAKEVNEDIWQLPIHDKYREELKSFSADMTNKGGRMAGASIAAAFLEKFVDNDRPWIHLDIAGSSYNSKEGATGRIVKTLAKLFV